MSRVLIPRAGGAKKVESTDIEKYFNCVVNNYVICGFTAAAQCPNVLAVDIAAGNARLEGLHLNNTTTCSVTCLAACDCTYLFATLTRDCCCRPTAWTFTTNLTGCVAADSLYLSTITTNCATVTAVTNAGNYAAMSIGVGACFPTNFPTDRAFWNTTCHSLWYNKGTVASPCWAYVCNDGNSQMTTSRNAILPTVEPQLNKFYMAGTLSEFYQDKGITVDDSDCNLWTDLSTDTKFVKRHYLTSYTTQCAFDAAWTGTTSGCVMSNNLACNRIDFCSPSSGFGTWNHDFGAAVSDTAAVIRFRLDLNTLTQGCDADNQHWYFGVMDINARPHESTPDFMGIRIDIDNCTFTWTLFDSNASNLEANCPDTTICSPALATGTYYVELRRTAATTYEVEFYSDSTYETSLAAPTTGTISASTTGLDFFYTGFWASGANDHVVNGSITNWEAFSGVTQVGV